MTERVLEIRVRDIQAMYSKQSILTKSLLVNPKNMQLISPPEGSKVKQTARKTAKSKPFCGLKNMITQMSQDQVNTITNGDDKDEDSSHTKAKREKTDIILTDKKDCCVNKDGKGSTSHNLVGDSEKPSDNQDIQSASEEKQIEKVTVTVKQEKETFDAINSTVNKDETTQNTTNSVSKKFLAVLSKPEVKTKKVTKQSIEEVIQNLNMKQHKASHVIHPLNASEPKATLKRCASPIDVGDAKKLKPSEKHVSNGIDDAVTLNGNHGNEESARGASVSVDAVTQTTNRCTCDYQEFKEMLKKETLALLEKEIYYKEELKLKTSECIKLREKCESVEKNFKRWIEFANKLQARVRAVDQQNKAIKHSLLKDLNRCEMSVQTDEWIPPVKKEDVTTIKQQTSKPSEQSIPQPNENRLPHNEAAQTKPKTNKSSVTPSDVIDLTSDTDVTPKPKNNNNLSVQEALQRILQTTPQAPSKPPQPTNNQNKPVPTFQPVNRNSTNLSEYKQIRQPNYYMIDNRHRTQNQMVPQTLQRQPQSTFTNLHPRSSASLACIKPKAIPPMYPPLPEAASASLPSKPIPKNAPNGLPPNLILGIKKSKGVIVLSWRNHDPNATNHAPVACYELFAHQESPGSSKQEWRQIGSESIAAMPLPMACTLTQFTSGCTYYFAVRGKDIYGRYGHFSKPCSSADVKE